MLRTKREIREPRDPDDTSDADEDDFEGLTFDQGGRIGVSYGHVSCEYGVRDAVKELGGYA